jgi:hypothetical protein
VERALERVVATPTGETSNFTDNRI